MTHHVIQEKLIDELVAGGHALHRAGLVTAFGHVSCRVADRPVADHAPDAVGAAHAGRGMDGAGPRREHVARRVPREAWIHLAIARRRPDVGAICRAQPPVATALASAGVPIVPLHGQGAFLGPRVPVFDDAVLVRNEARAVALAEQLADEPALLLRGNGAVTVGADIGGAVARMWVLEASAQMNSVAASAGTPTPLSADEQAAWRGVSAEILGRIWADLRHPALP